jgi:hypothetical protein
MQLIREINNSIKLIGKVFKEKQMSVDDDF